VLPLSSLALVGLAWYRIKESRDEEDRRYARRLACGMTAGFIGDLWMAGGVVTCGLLFFGIGHGCYLRGMTSRAKAWALGGRRRRLMLWAVWLMAGVGIWYGVAAAGAAPNLRFLADAALPYTILLASTAGVASGLAATDRRFLGLAIGGALFLGSDAVIALRMFRPELYQSLPDGIRGIVVWATYGPAQMLILDSVRAARRQPATSRS
jgi:hypothetical protein